MYANGNQNIPLPEPEHDKGIASFEVSTAPPGAKKQADTSAGYIPAGSFVRVALLGGLDAPTGGQAQTNPHPILMRTQDNAFLPNRYRFEIKECFILASSYGDISSERAYGRLENLSCVRRNGKAVDIAVKGYVVGEDGKAGMRGRLISKQGQVLANALLAGIGSGIGQAFQNSATTQSISPLGTINTVTPGQQLQNGVGMGIGKTLDRLSKYYIDLAEKLFPVIEIDAGRTVEVIFTKGFSFEDDQAMKLQGDYSEVWKRGKKAMNEPLDN
jgi:conjugal transfer pilus assembly protein TraB